MSIENLSSISVSVRLLARNKNLVGYPGVAVSAGMLGKLKRKTYSFRTSVRSINSLPKSLREENYKLLVITKQWGLLMKLCWHSSEYN